MKELLEFSTWEEDDTTIMEAKLRLTARTYIPNEYINTSPYLKWYKDCAKRQLSYEIGRKLYGEIIDKLLVINNKISIMTYSDSRTRANISKEVHKDINEIIHSYDNI